MGMIPAEAVGAATDAMQQFALVEDRDGLQTWEAYAKLALEAAAPYMLAAGWEEGKDAVWTFLGNQDPQRERPTNPYRPTE